MPELRGKPIRVYARKRLVAHRGQLLSNHRASERHGPELGQPVHAATFIKERKIVLEIALFESPAMLRLILLHEMFHFVWIRLSNRTRSEFTGLLIREFENGALGELGESAGMKKDLLLAQAQEIGSSRLWRDYVCESFCDTAAWFYSGLERYETFTLAKRWKRCREAWFRNSLEEPLPC